MQQQKGQIVAAELAGKHNEARTLAENLSQILGQLEAKFKRSVETLSKSYDAYMKQMAPAPAFLPVRVKVIFSKSPVSNLENV